MWSWISFTGNNGKEYQNWGKRQLSSESICFPVRYHWGLTGVDKVHTDVTQGLESPLENGDTELTAKKRVPHIKVNRAAVWFTSAL